MNTNNTYLRFLDGEAEAYASIVNVQNSGNPLIMEGLREGQEMECDGFLYRIIKDAGIERFAKIDSFSPQTQTKY